MKACVFTVKVGLFTKVRIWSGFCETSLEKDQNLSGFSPIFLKFGSRFSLTLGFLSPENKVDTLNVVQSQPICE